jgi:K+/H+ antiporter YhaU regulatory subunit KhtT
VAIQTGQFHRFQQNYQSANQCQQVKKKIDREVEEVEEVLLNA